MSQPTTIDVHMHGFPGITGAFVVRGEATALVETGPKSSVDRLLAGLDEAGVERVDYIVVTHIHLDHAGAVGTLARKWPAAKVVTHPVGAPHLADPSKLWASAGRIYGSEMERLWGGIDPVPEASIVEISDGGTVDLGGRSLEAIETPGHATHHHAYLDDASGTLFAGDSLGVRLPGLPVIRPATPPPEFDLETAIKSIGKVRDAGAERLCFTHFGTVGGEDVAKTCEAAVDSLVQWAGWVRSAREATGVAGSVTKSTPEDVERVADFVREAAIIAYGETLGPDDVARLEQTTSYWMNTWGYMRYMDKLARTPA